MGRPIVPVFCFGQVQLMFFRISIFLTLYYKFSILVSLLPFTLEIIFLTISQNIITFFHKYRLHFFGAVQGFLGGTVLAQVRRSDCCDNYLSRMVLYTIYFISFNYWAFHLNLASACTWLISKPIVAFSSLHA